MVQLNHGIFFIALWCLFANVVADKDEKKYGRLRQRLVYGIHEEPALVHADESEYEDSFGSVKKVWGDEENWGRLLDSTDMSMDMDCSPYMRSESK
jgi:hypothetical protein